MSRTSSVEDIQRQLDNAVQRIHEDLDKTEEARNRLVREVYDQARSKIMQEVEEERQRVEEDLKVARRMAFAPPVLEGKNIDEAHVAKWYHEEIEKLKAINDPGLIMEMLQDALMFSNPVKAKAILCKGYALGNGEIVRRYLEAFPDEQQPWDAYSDAAEQYNEFQRATSLFSASSRLRPLEHYLS